MGIRRLAFISFALGYLTACGPARQNYVYIVDTSGSMVENKLFDEVRASVHELSTQLNEGDNLHLLTFDSGVARKLEILGFKREEDLPRLNSMLSELQAKGQHTNLVAALDSSLSLSQELTQKFPGSKTRIILYTDGRHDPPKGWKSDGPVNFAELFQKYYGSGARAQDWFVYYVELGAADPGLHRFLTAIGGGEIITLDMLRKGGDFTRKGLTYLLWAGLSLLAILILAALYQIFHPWFGKASLVAVSGATSRRPPDVDLSRYKKRFFRFEVQVPILSSWEDENPRVGMDFKGRYYLKAGGKTRYLAEGETFKVGSKEYQLKKAG